MKIEITKKVDKTEIIDIDLPYFYKHEISGHDSTIYGKITHNGQPHTHACLFTVHTESVPRPLEDIIQTEYTFAHFDRSIIRDWNEVVPYLSEEYKSNEEEYNRAIENAKRLVNDYSSIEKSDAYKSRNEAFMHYTTLASFIRSNKWLPALNEAMTFNYEITTNEKSHRISFREVSQMISRYKEIIDESCVTDYNGEKIKITVDILEEILYFWPPEKVVFFVPFFIQQIVIPTLSELVLDDE
jgi:hypothetical protein